MFIVFELALKVNLCALKNLYILLDVFITFGRHDSVSHEYE